MSVTSLPRSPSESRRPARAAGRRARRPLHGRRRPSSGSTTPPSPGASARSRTRSAAACSRAARPDGCSRRSASTRSPRPRASSARSAALSPDAPRLSGVVRLSATDGFSGFIAAPAIVAVRRAHPDVSLEIVAAHAARRAAARRRRPRGRRRAPARASRRGDPPRRLRARPLREPRVPRAHGTPRITGRPRRARRSSTSSSRCCRSTRSTRRGGRRARMVDAVSSTNVYVHVDATRAGAGFGLLPAFLADRHDDLVRLFADEIDERPALLAGVPARGAAAADRARLHRRRCAHASPRSPDELLGRRGRAGGVTPATAPD